MEKIEKEMIYKCSCGCKTISFTLNDWDGDKYLSIDTYLHGFYERQSPIWGSIKDRLKFIWYAILGKQYHAYEIFLENEEIDRFFEEMRKFIDD